ncbi:MAG: hypothetical protein ABIO46_07285 [Chitinophagales bacterium]
MEYIGKFEGFEGFEEFEEFEEFEIVWNGLVILSFFREDTISVLFPTSVR